jgi:hypothetical protein
MNKLQLKTLFSLVAFIQNRLSALVVKVYTVEEKTIFVQYPNPTFKNFVGKGKAKFYILLYCSRI